ncbi:MULTISPECIES: hypothetical protein [Epilithonimonas]|uniref:hypothetical protein n=1 Tax=Epilithonimonas TaxID=2782229 RepID=UPI000A8480A4|nr:MULTISPECIES: hypothetical protein [Epilithonimonas]
MKDRILLFLSTINIQAQKTQRQPLMIAEQGSFAVGGTVITNPGTFNPSKPT